MLKQILIPNNNRGVLIIQKFKIINFKMNKINCNYKLQIVCLQQKSRTINLTRRIKYKQII